MRGCSDIATLRPRKDAGGGGGGGGEGGASSTRPALLDSRYSYEDQGRRKWLCGDKHLAEMETETVSTLLRIVKISAYRVWVVYGPRQADTGP